MALIISKDKICDFMKERAGTMEQIVINGGKPLRGTVEVSGFKNAALPIMFATVLTNDVCIIGNLPAISDVILTLEILRSMGVEIEQIDDTTYRIDSRHATYGCAPDNLVQKMRGSVYILGAELGRFAHASAGTCGGCDFGQRPIDQHVKAFRALGAAVEERDDGRVTADAEGLTGAVIYFDMVSVGATVNAILASVMAEGMTILENAAHEPHIVDLANFLNACGASISGAGTDVIKIRGVPSLHGCTYDIIPDMIEAGTYMVAAAVTGGKIEITNVIPKHLESISAKLREIGAEVEEGDESVTVTAGGHMIGVHVKTMPYPGFPTDMHPQMSVLLCLVEGVSYVNETIFEHRFKYVEQLRKMGASITLDEHMATIQGGNCLLPAAVNAVDLRAGAAMILAGLAARGKTTVSDIVYVERGYDNIVGKLQALGADIRKI